MCCSDCHPYYHSFKCVWVCELSSKLVVVLLFLSFVCVCVCMCSYVSLKQRGCFLAETGEREGVVRVCVHVSVGIVQLILLKRSFIPLLCSYFYLMRSFGVRSACRRLAGNVFRLLSVSRVQLRFVAAPSGTGPEAAPGPNPVNVESFTLNEAVVKSHLDAAHQWQRFGDSLEILRNQDCAMLIAHINSGFELLRTVGREDSPILCEWMLHLELAQAYYNNSRYDDALDAVQKAEVVAKAAEPLDDAKIAETRQLSAYINLKMGSAKSLEAAESTLRALLKWIDGESRTAMPMVSVAARKLRRTVLLGLGKALERIATLGLSSATLLKGNPSHFLLRNEAGNAGQSV